MLNWPFKDYYLMVYPGKLVIYYIFLISWHYQCELWTGSHGMNTPNPHKDCYLQTGVTKIVRYDPCFSLAIFFLFWAYEQMRKILVKYDTNLPLFHISQELIQLIMGLIREQGIIPESNWSKSPVLRPAENQCVSQGLDLQLRALVLVKRSSLGLLYFIRFLAPTLISTWGLRPLFRALATQMSPSLGLVFQYKQYTL